MTELPRVIALIGPTAAGKTEAAMALADLADRPVALISVDSAMIYRQMDIGTAKPGLELLRRYPHGLIDIRDPAETYSAAQFVEDADRLVRAALTEGRLPVLVGGTMLYFRAFREGIAPMPAADPAIRAALVEEAAHAGTDVLYRRLERVDPLAAARIHPHNFSRIQRALEVHTLTGRPLSAFWADSAGAEKRLGVNLQAFAIEAGDRANLHARIAARFDEMLARGFIDEVAALKARGDLSTDLPSMRAVGYRQVWEHLEGTVDRAGMRERALAATRQLAKRQLTWLKGFSDVTTVPSGDLEALARQLLAG